MLFPVPTTPAIEEHVYQLSISPEFFTQGYQSRLLSIMRAQALPKTVTSFLTRHCPQKPARPATPVRYKAAKQIYHHRNGIHLNLDLCIEQGSIVFIP